MLFRFRVILDEAEEVGHDVGDDDPGMGDVALMSPSKMETLGEAVYSYCMRYR